MTSRDAGVTTNKTIGLASRRLAILDLSSAGAQPMSTADRRYWIAYNGEVYNYLELRRELESLGCRFESGTDTEVVLYALSVWGRSALSRFVGMFALAFLDTQLGSLLLARDHFGMKPLFLVKNSSQLVFASEITPLFEFVSPFPTINSRRAFEYLRFGRTDESSETMIDGIENLQAGHTIEVCTRTGVVRPQQAFWQLAVPTTVDISFSEAVRTTREKFLRNVELHLRSDVPIGACLSGGIDSSACVAAMRYVKGPGLSLHTFTYAAGSGPLDETKWASIVSSSVGASAHATKGSATDLAQEMDALIQLQGEPFATTSIYAQQLVFRLIAKNGIKVVIDGQGADEMLGGYPIFVAARIASALRSGKLADAWRLALSVRSKGGFAQVPFVAGQYLLPKRLQAPFRRMMGREILPAWVSRQWSQASSAGSSSSRALDADILKTELHASLTGTLKALLRYEDRNSMAQSVESRLPFLTVDLVEFLLSLPDEYLISPTGTTKVVLRESMRGIVPDAILDRSDKVSFQTPESKWMIELSEWARPILQSDVAKSCPMLDFEVATSTWARTVNDTKNYRAWIWRWLNLVRWAQLNSISWNAAS